VAALRVARAPYFAQQMAMRHHLANKGNQTRLAEKYNVLPSTISQQDVNLITIHIL
jgi:hypothetical protein